MQGRMRLQKHDAGKRKFYFGNGFRGPPMVAKGDSGAPVLCACNGHDPLHAGSSGQGVMFLMLSDGFCYETMPLNREAQKGNPNCGAGTDVRALHKWILDTFSENQLTPEYFPDLVV